jgi:hopanoid biosynthesis associated protein HpnK
MRRLIVNADDFGLHPAVNRAIIQGYTSGCITSTSLMPGGTAFQDAIEKATKYPQLGIGVHLTLVGESPVVDPARIPSLVNGEGRLFSQHSQFLARFLQGRINLSEVRFELAAQLDKAITSGIPITHVDSHQHLHVLPGIIDIVLDIAAKYDIKALRIPAVPLLFTGGYPYTVHQILGRSGLVLLAKIAKYKAQKRGFDIPEHFFGIVAGGSMREECLLKLIKILPTGVSEIMIHPGDDDIAINAACNWQHRYQEELAAVMSNQVRNCLIEQRIRLVSFRELEHG